MESYNCQNSIRVLKKIGTLGQECTGSLNNQSFKLRKIGSGFSDACMQMHKLLNLPFVKP